MIVANNILLVSGGGRNVGKTSFVCATIEKFAQQQHEIVGIKISSHFHALPNSLPLLFSDDTLVIARETLRHTAKDSSRFLAAGAAEVLYVQAKNDGLQRAVPQLVNFIRNRACICESGGLREFITPGLHVYFTNTENNKELLFEPDVTICNYDYSWLNLHLENNSWKLK